MFKVSSKDVKEVRDRAANIRNTWSASERQSRMGLPPDTPTKIRDYVMALKTVTWAVESPAAR